MFTIKFKDKTHRVVFQHALDGTSCFIQREQLDKTLVNVAIGSSHRSPKDTPCKATGRKIALKRALGTDDDEDIPPAFDKETRKVFWTAYLAKCRH